MEMMTMGDNDDNYDEITKKQTDFGVFGVSFVSTVFHSDGKSHRINSRLIKLSPAINQKNRERERDKTIVIIIISSRYSTPHTHSLLATKLRSLAPKFRMDGVYVCML